MSRCCGCWWFLSALSTGGGAVLKTGRSPANGRSGSANEQELDWGAAEWAGSVSQLRHSWRKCLRLELLSSTRASSWGVNKKTSGGTIGGSSRVPPTRQSCWSPGRWFDGFNNGDLRNSYEAGGTVGAVTGDFRWVGWSASTETIYGLALRTANRFVFL